MISKVMRESNKVMISEVMMESKMLMANAVIGGIVKSSFPVT